MNSYTHPLSTDQATKLRALLKDIGFQFAPKPYTLFFAQKLGALQLHLGAHALTPNDGRHG